MSYYSGAVNSASPYDAAAAYGSNYGGSYGSSNTYGAASYGASASYGACGSYGGGSRGYGSYGAGQGYSSAGPRHEELGSKLPSVDWKKLQLIHFEKNFYHEHPNVSALTDEEAEEIRRQNDISIVKGKLWVQSVTGFFLFLMLLYLLVSSRNRALKAGVTVLSDVW